MPFAQQDNSNIDWYGATLQTLCHFFVTLSRVLSLSTIAYLYPHWTVLAGAIHILMMSTWLLMVDRSPFCGHNKLAEIAFPFALGGVYLFTYILPVEGRTRYRYTVYYTICLLQNITCALIWYYFADEFIRSSLYFYPVLALSIVPYVLGLLFMVIYYLFFHPKVSSKDEEMTEMSS